LPIYEYQCICCPTRFELKRNFDEDDPVTCPQCGGTAQRIFSPVPVIFKGSGFYSTDSRGNHGHPSSEGNADQAKVGNSEDKS